MKAYPANAPQLFPNPLPGSGGDGDDVLGTCDSGDLRGRGQSPAGAQVTEKIFLNKKILSENLWQYFTRRERYGA